MHLLNSLWTRSVRFGFRLLYNEMAFTYDLVSKAVSRGQWRCWQRAALQYMGDVGDETILELAHGTGDLQIDLANLGVKSIGYDLSPYMGYLAGRKLKRLGLSPRLVRGLAQQLPFADGVFPAVIATFPTRFIFQPETLSEIARILQDDGRLVIVLSGRFTTSGVVAEGLEFLYRATGQREEDIPEMYEQVLALFQAAGFTASWERVPCKNSEALIIFAQKRASNQAKV